MRVQIAIAFSCLLFVFSCGLKPHDFQEDLDKSLAQLNEKCPKMLDDETRIDAILSNGPLSIVYKYTLVKVAVDSIDTIQFRKVMWPNILSHIRITSEMKKIRDNNVTIEYDYHDGAGKLITRFVIKPADYQNPKYNEQNSP